MSCDGDPGSFRVVGACRRAGRERLAGAGARLHPAAVAPRRAAGGRRELAARRHGDHRPRRRTVLETLATRDDVDLVVVATGGIVSLRPVLAALRAGKVVATANKETLVAGGHLVMPLARALAAPARGDAADPLGVARSAGCGRSIRSTRRSGSASSASDLRPWRG